MIIITILFVIFLSYFSLPLVSIGYIFDSRNKMWYLSGLAIFLGMLAYSLKPNVGLDLNVYFTHMEKLCTIDFSVFLEELSSSTEPLFLILLYLISLTKDFHLLTFFITTIVYIIIFYILYDYSNNLEKINHLQFTTVLLFLLLTMRYIYIISGLRNPLAIALFSLIFYYDIYKEKSKKVLLLYIIPCLIHNSILIMVILRCLGFLLLENKTKFNLIKKFTIIIILLGLYYFLFNSESFIEKTDYYFDVYNGSFGIFSNIDFLVQQILMIIFIVINIKNYKISKNYIYKLLNIINFMLIIIGYQSFFIFDRYFQLMIVLNCLSFMYCIKSFKNNIISILLFFSSIFFVSQQIITILQCNFEIYDNIFKSVFYIFYEIIKVFLAR